jgi:DHA1 family tetracycline resistance protein-like MFS transporter
MWFALGTLMTVFVLSTELRFGWGPGENGAALALVGTMGAVVQGFLVRRVIGKVGERLAALGGFVLSALAYTVFAVAPVGWWIYVAICINSLGQVANPAVRALVSSRAGPERQGRTMGALSVIEGLTAIGSPVIASGLFSVFAAPNAPLHFPGAPFIAAACSYLLAIMAVRGITKAQR